MSEIEIRDAKVSDAELILKFVTELAKYEKAEHEVKASVSDIERTLFSDENTTKAIISYIDGVAVGFAVYFLNYSTWLGKNGIYLEDLYVTPEHRGSGAGVKLIKHIAKIAVENDCGRFEWSVLDWNEPAIDFYNSIGATPQDEWIIYRLDGQALKDFAEC
ncbi:MAG: GNAT family N-acetyltransferase [Desulfobacterales bacterium]|nr:GNAT family N-acetyltransferase [Desulfobacterales bacterium]MCP4164103.1 GNAT family N-acetyltransferase [Deltaproteobacteria bacterium]